MALRAIAFDIDGTLYSSARLYLRLGGFALRHGILLHAFSAVRKELHRLAMDPEHRALRPVDGADFRRFQAELLAHRLGQSPETAAEKLETAIYRDLVKRFQGLPPYAGAEECLKNLKAAGYRLSALSDFPASEKLKRLGLAEYFELALCSEDSGLLKPAPDSFLDMASRMGLEPQEILYVGNSPAFDVAGARGAGMRAVLRGSEEATGAELRFTDWSDLTRHCLENKD